MYIYINIDINIYLYISSGADRNVQNDEPLFFSSSSDEDEPIREREAGSQPINPRKRPAGGHTPLDLAQCQKVFILSK